MTGVLTGVVVTYNSSRTGYFSVEPPSSRCSSKGKKISDPFRVGGDVDAVSRASIHRQRGRAIRDSARMVAKQLLPRPQVVDPAVDGWPRSSAAAARHRAARGVHDAALSAYSRKSVALNT